MTESCVRGRTPRKSLKIRDLTPKFGVPSAVVIGEWNAHQFDLLLRKRVGNAHRCRAHTRTLQKTSKVHTRIAGERIANPGTVGSNPAGSARSPANRLSFLRHSLLMSSLESYDFG